MKTAERDALHDGAAETPQSPPILKAPPSRRKAKSVSHVETYLDEYYGSLTEENLTIGRFLAGAARPRENALSPRRALDMGCGPTLLYWALFFDGYDEYHGVDAGEDSVASLRGDLVLGRSNRMHPRYRPVCQHLDSQDPGGQRPRFRSLCQRVRSVAVGDAGGAWTFPDGSMELVTMVFSLEVLATTDRVRGALSEARRVLSPGGRLVLCTLCETTSWRSGDYVGRCLHFTRESLEADLAAAGFGEASVERRAATTAIACQQGYQWMLFATATRT
jgi:SAM-dependent methyltransferase